MTTSAVVNPAGCFCLTNVLAVDLQSTSHHIAIAAALSAQKVVHCLTAEDPGRWGVQAMREQPKAFVLPSTYSWNWNDLDRDRLLLGTIVCLGLTGEEHAFRLGVQ